MKWILIILFSASWASAQSFEMPPDPNQPFLETSSSGLEAEFTGQDNQRLAHQGVALEKLSFPQEPLRLIASDPPETEDFSSEPEVNQSPSPNEAY